MGRRSSTCKFPVARIKKIMQADEDVGKVAQATPVAVSKALELFMQSLVHSTLSQARSSGSRKLTAYHLKRAVHANETFDFLKDIVEKVPEPAGAGAGGAGMGSVGTEGMPSSSSSSVLGSGKKEEGDEEGDGEGEAEGEVAKGEEAYGGVGQKREDGQEDQKEDKKRRRRV